MKTKNAGTWHVNLKILKYIVTLVCRLNLLVLNVRIVTSVRHSTLMEKFALLFLPDVIYNWIGSFFSEHFQVTAFRGEISNIRSTLASFIQGSADGPTSYVIRSPRQRTKQRSMLMTPISWYRHLYNVHSCADVIQHIEDSASENNLTLNKKKSVEMVITAPRSRRKICNSSYGCCMFRKSWLF